MSLFYAAAPAEFFNDTGQFGEAYGANALTFATFLGRKSFSFSTFTSFNSTVVPLMPASMTTSIFEGWIYTHGINFNGILIDYFEGGTVHMRIGCNSSNQIYASRAASTTIGTSTETLADDTWYYLQIKYVIHDTTGSVKVILNGTTFLDITGADTRNGGTGIINVLRFANTTDNHRWGSFYFADDTGSTFNDLTDGNVEFEVISPNGAGNSTQFTPSAGANYETVDEKPLSDTDYNDGSTDTHKDTFAMGNLVGSVGSILAVVPVAIAEKTTADATSLNTIARHSASEGAGADFALSLSSMKQVASYHPTNPSTSSAWTESEVNAMEAGYEVSI